MPGCVRGRYLLVENTDILITWNAYKATHSTHQESGLGNASGIRVKDKKIWPGSNTGSRRLQEQTMTVKGIHDRDRPQVTLVFLLGQMPTF